MISVLPQIRDTLFDFQETNASQRTSQLIKSKAKSPDPPVVAGRGMVLDGGKSLELITRNIWALFGGEIAR